MRRIIFAMMLTVLAQPAWSQENKVKAHPSATPESELKSEAEAFPNFEEFSKKLQDAGFKDIQIIPQAVLIHAKDKSDKPVMMIVDTLSMAALQLQLPAGSETPHN